MSADHSLDSWHCYDCNGDIENCGSYIKGNHCVARFYDGDL